MGSIKLSYPVAFRSAILCTALLAVFILSIERPFESTDIIGDSAQSSEPHAPKTRLPIVVNGKSDTLVVYVYYDGVRVPQDQHLKPPSLNQPRNFEFFLRHGLQSNVDYLFILNREPDPTVKLPEHLPNVYVWHRNNSCYDLGAFKLGVERMQELYKRTYPKKIMVNASVRGPFLPFYTRMCWTDAFLSGLDERVKMVGTTFNCRTGQNPHLQTMVVALDETGYDVASRNMGCPTKMEDAIKSECSLTKSMLWNDYGLAGIMPSAAGNLNYLAECDHGDINFPKAWFGKGQLFMASHMKLLWNLHSPGMTLHPYDLIFIKANRQMDDHALAHYTGWHDAFNRSSCPFHIKVM